VSPCLPAVFAAVAEGDEKGIRCKSVTLGRRCERELASQDVTVMVYDGKARWAGMIRKSEDLPWLPRNSERSVRINPHGKLFLCGFFYACCSTGIPANP
jgi:ketosteroid isomerase-like protein